MQTNLKKVFALLLSISLLINPAISWSLTGDDLPDIGTAADAILSPAEEKRIGKAFMRWVRAGQPVMDDPLLDDYINELGNKLVNNSDGLGSHFKFFLVDDPQINAYAGPDGYIGIYTGLLLTTESESELASVVAHEISHVTQRHLIRAWHTNSNMTLVQSAALLAAIILGAAAGGDAAIAAISGTQAALVQQQINFTRANEKEADRFGISILNESDFDPRAMPTFFARMGRANKSYGTQLPEFLRTHPVTNSRIADSLGRAEQFPYRQYADSFRYLLTRATIKEHNYSDPDDAIRYFKQTLKEGRYRNKDANRYGLTRALLRNHQYQEASQVLNDLRHTYPDTLEFIITAAQIKVAQRKFDDAIRTLTKASARFPLSYPLHITLAEIYLRADNAQQAYTNLKKISQIKKDNASVYKLLARASAALENTAESHEHMATHYYLMGSLESSKLQLEIALRIKDLPYFDLARLESRLKDIEAEIEELKEKKKNS